MRRRAVPFALGVAAIAVGAAIALGRCGTRSAMPTPSAAAAPAIDRAPTAATRALAAAIAAGSAAGSAAGDPAPGALPGSLEGTEADGAITADAAGHLIVDLELRRLFDHFLAATGEEPLATMRARIVAVLRARLPVTAAAEAEAILDQYLAYREAARTLTATADPRAGLDQIHDLRAKIFAPEVARAFFADEEAATYAAIARRDALIDPALSAAERDRKIAEIDARLPPAVREARAAATAPIDQMAREQAMRAAGATDAQIAAARTAALGADAAARLAELDRTRAAWDARLARFRAARAALLADTALDAAARDRRIAELLASSFSPEERIRVDALDRR
jgi:lipase chaperone LimK